MLKIAFILLGVFCYQHLIRDYLQDRGVRNWYTTFGHLSFINDTPINNHIGMVVLGLLGTEFFYLAFHAA